MKRTGGTGGKVEQRTKRACKASFGMGDLEPYRHILQRPILAAKTHTHWRYAGSNTDTPTHPFARRHTNPRSSQARELE
jgi:hypothetical protein